MAKKTAPAVEAKAPATEEATPKVQKFVSLQIEETLYPKVDVTDTLTLKGLIDALKVRVAADKLRNPHNYKKLNERIVKVDGQKMTVPQMTSWILEKKRQYEIFYVLSHKPEMKAVADEVDKRLKAGLSVPITFGNLAERNFDAIVEAVGLDKPKTFIPEDVTMLLGM